VDVGLIGVICLKGLPFTPHNVTASGDAVENTSVVVNVGLAPDPSIAVACGADGQIGIVTQTVSDPPANFDHSIYLTIN
jgi:hypothetical protein